MTKLVFNNPHFLKWKKRLEENGNVLQNIEVLGAISRDNKNLFAAFLDCRILTPENTEIPRCVLICDDSVVVVPVLRCIENNEIYTLMVRQRRIIDGGFTTEFAAGGVEQSANLIEAACKETREELHMSVSHEEMIPLGTDSIKLNPSFSGDLVHFFYFQRDVPRTFLEKMDNMSTGCHQDNEYIKIKVLKMTEVNDVMTSSALIGIKLLESALNCKF